MNEQTAQTLQAIPFAPGYFASEQGEIWSTKNANQWEPIRKLRPTFNKRLGRFQIRLYTPSGKWRAYVHQLTALAWHGVPDGWERGSDAWQVDHIDEVRTNNHKDNLRWLTKAEHEAHHYS